MALDRLFRESSGRDGHELRHTVVDASFQNRDDAYVNSKPREDRHLVDRYHDIFIVADGITRTALPGKRYQTPSPAARAAEAVVHASHQVLATVGPSLQPAVALRSAARAANRAVRDLADRLFRTTPVDYEVNDLPGACALISFIRGTTLHYLFNADCVGYAVKADGTLDRFTPSGTAALERWRSTRNGPEAVPAYIRRHIRNNPIHPARYGAFTGQESALLGDLLTVGTLSLKGLRGVVLTTDGFDELFESGEQLDLGDLDGLRRRAEELEGQSGRRSDDKTIISLRFS